MDADRTDEELMISAAEGDLRSFDALVGRYADRIYGFTRRLAGDPDIAEDAAQEAFIKLWKNRKRFDREGSFRPWIFAIARNAALDIMRKRRDAVFSALRAHDDDAPFGDDISGEDIDLPEAFDQNLVRDALEKTLLDLSPDQRAAVILHDMEGMTFEEAGRVLGKSPNTVKSHYRRAILSLRRRLDAPKP